MKFNPAAMVLSWHSNDVAGSKPLGEFSMDPVVMIARPTAEHARPNEIKVRLAGVGVSVSCDRIGHVACALPLPRSPAPSLPRVCVAVCSLSVCVHACAFGDGARYERVAGRCCGDRLRSHGCHVAAALGGGV